MKSMFYNLALASVLAFAPAAGVSAASQITSVKAASGIARAPLVASSDLPGAVDTATVVSGFDISGISSWDALGSPANFVGFAFIGASSRVTGIGWDINLETVGFSWLSEAIIAFRNLDQSAGVNLTTGVGDDFSGTSNYSSGGIVDLVGLGLDFTVGADGNLRVEFFESFDDNPGGIDANYLRGSTISVQWETVDSVIPEPATWAMMIAGFGLVGFAARRRRETSVSA